jgi:hypothetical protein
MLGGYASEAGSDDLRAHPCPLAVASRRIPIPPRLRRGSIRQPARQIAERIGRMAGPVVPRCSEINLDTPEGTARCT